MANRWSLREREANLQRDRERLIAVLEATRSDRNETESNVADVTRAFDEQERALKERLRQQVEMVARVQSYRNHGYAAHEALNGQRRLALDCARQIADLRARQAELTPRGGCAGAGRLAEDRGAGVRRPLADLCRDEAPSRLRG